MVISVTKFDIIENRNRKGLDKFQFKCWICLEKCESLFLCVCDLRRKEGVDIRFGFVICVRDLKMWGRRCEHSYLSEPMAKEILVNIPGVIPFVIFFEKVSEKSRCLLIIAKLHGQGVFHHWVWFHRVTEPQLAPFKSRFAYQYQNA